MRVEVDPAGYCKLMLHAAQHPSADVLGVLLGTAQEGQVRAAACSLAQTLCILKRFTRTKTTRLAG
jgi:Uncharacterised protein family (UPF0172)